MVRNEGIAAARVSPAARLLRYWNRFGKRPGGSLVFGRIIALAIPYTGSIRPLVRDVRPGYARVQLRDRRRVRNHLKSIHAIALANVGEFTGGLAMTATVPADIRSILTRLEVEFLKKARGTVTAECRCAVPPVIGTVDHVVQTEVRDSAGDVVARVTATWRLSPL